MTSISHAPYLIAVVVAVFCALVHRRIAARKGPPAKLIVAMNVQRSLLADLPALLAPTGLWLAALAAAHALLPFPSVGDTSVAAVLSAVGLAVGVAGMAPLIVAGALLFGPILADAGYTLTLVTAMILGSLLVFALVRPIRWRGSAAQLRVLAAYGGAQPPAPSQYLFAGLAVAVSALPVVATALVPADLDSTGTTLRRLCSALVAAQLLSWQWSLRREHRWMRNLLNLALAVAVAAGFALAAAFGEAIVGVWTRYEWLTGWTGGLVLTCAALLGWLFSKGKPDNLLVDVPFRLIRGVLTSAILPCFAGVCLFPSPGTVTATTILASAEAVTLAVGRRRPATRAVSRHLLAQALRLAPGERAHFLGPWLYDSIHTHPARPDLSLVRIYSGMAASAAAGNMIPGQVTMAKDADLRRPLSGVKALKWIFLATEALDRVEREVVPRVPAAAVPELRAALEAARADAELARAVVHSTAGRWPQVSAGLRGAAERYQHVGAPHRAALALALAAVVSAVHLAQPHAAERSLDAIPGPAARLPTIRYLGLVLRAQLAPAEGEERTALLAQADAAAPDWSSLNGDARRDGELPAWDEDLAEGVLNLCMLLRRAVTVSPRVTVVVRGGASYEDAPIRTV